MDLEYFSVPPNFHGHLVRYIAITFKDYCSHCLARWHNGDSGRKEEQNYNNHEKLYLISSLKSWRLY